MHLGDRHAEVDDLPVELLFLGQTDMPGQVGDIARMLIPPAVELELVHQDRRAALDQKQQGK